MTKGTRNRREQLMGGRASARPLFFLLKLFFYKKTIRQLADCLIFITVNSLADPRALHLNVFLNVNVVQ